MHLLHISALILLYIQYPMAANPKSIKCYDCNSDSHPSCADPFDPNKNEKFLKQCNTPKTNGSVPLCRKIDHHIKDDKGNDHHRIIRACGWIPYKRDCYITGSEKYRTYVCACREDECNSGFTIGSKWSLLSFLIVLYFYVNFHTAC